MRFPEFRLDHWLDRFDQAPFNLAQSMGPALSLSELASLTGEDPGRVLDGPLEYTPTAGRPALRAAIAAAHGVEADDVQVLNGASEGLVVLFALAAGPGANVVLPHPCYPAVSVLAGAFGVAVRPYRLEPARGFAVDPDEIAGLIDADTRFVFVNSPHNPTGAVVGDADMERIAEACAARGTPVVSDEVYHPLYFGVPSRSASRLPGTIVLGSCSKVYALSGARVGWMIDRDAARRRCAWNARAALTISNAAPGEALAEVVVRHRDRVLARTRAAAERNLARLDAFFARHADRFGWVRPGGGTVGFPWLRDAADARPWCESLGEAGVVFAPGDCFDRPAHFRVGFGGAPERFEAGLARVEGRL